jgi:ethanolamine transporter EutH
MNEDEYLIIGVLGILVIIPIICIGGSLIHCYLFPQIIIETEEAGRYQEINVDIKN